MMPLRKMIRFCTERRSRCRVPVLWPLEIHWRISDSSMVRRLPLSDMPAPVLRPRSAVFPGEVPEEVVAPAVGRALDAEAQRQRGQRGRTPGLAEQREADLFGRM